MSKRAKPEVRVMDYFKTAELAAAEVVLSMAAEIVKARKPAVAKVAGGRKGVKPSVTVKPAVKPNDSDPED